MCHFTVQLYVLVTKLEDLWHNKGATVTKAECKKAIKINFTPIGRMCPSVSSHISQSKQLGNYWFIILRYVYIISCRMNLTFICAGPMQLLLYTKVNR